MQEQSFAGATEPAQRLRAPSPCQRDPWVSLPKPFTALEFWPLWWAVWLFLVTRRNANLVSFLQKNDLKARAASCQWRPNSKADTQTDGQPVCSWCASADQSEVFFKNRFYRFAWNNSYVFTNQVSQCMWVSTYFLHSNGSWGKVENTNNHDLSQKNCSRVHHPLEELNCT